MGSCDLQPIRLVLKLWGPKTHSGGNDICLYMVFPYKEAGAGKHSVNSEERKWRRTEAKTSRTGVMTEEAGDGIKDTRGGVPGAVGGWGMSQGQGGKLKAQGRRDKECRRSPQSWVPAEPHYHI